MDEQQEIRGRALIGTVISGSPVVLATDQSQVAFDCESVTHGVDDIGLARDEDFPTPGLYLWEGVSRLEWPDTLEGGGPEIVYRGTVRPVLPEEVAALYAMTPPAPCFFCDNEPCVCEADPPPAA